ncbi:hypothetical protein, conserved [Eimeria maxima]|uniref:Uncharacterized protein n=1 Tax=Eimeria maxima TaxID=5804 RepID=U6M075_EIMMA|nr:hypothetical protein, conserved [Eimeria maxima]CDJ57416.1 hypothetical protein, conserved [Eimeria maxima]
MCYRALRETLKTYVENNAKKGGPHNHSDALKQVLKGPTQILGAAAAAAASAAASAAAAAAGALSDVLAGASCRAPLNRSDLDELLPGQCSSWDEAAATAAAATEATPAAAAATPAETITTPSSAAQASTSSRFGAPRTLQRRAPLEAPGGLMAAAASLMSFGLSMQLPRPQKSDTRGPLRAPTPVGSQPLESGKDALCLRCKDTAAEVALLEEEVDEAERRCLLAIQFLSDSAEIIEELITSSQEAADSSSSSSSSSRCCSSESTCDSEAPHEDEPKVNKLRGDLLFATGPRQRRRQEQQQQ